MKTIKDFKYWLKGYLDEAKKNNFTMDKIIDDIATQVEQLTDELNINKIEKIVKKEIDKIPYKPFEFDKDIPNPYNNIVTMYGCNPSPFKFNDGHTSITSTNYNSDNDKNNIE
jgi:hypothetical protein